MKKLYIFRFGLFLLSHAIVLMGSQRDSIVQNKTSYHCFLEDLHNESQESLDLYKSLKKDFPKVPQHDQVLKTLIDLHDKSERMCLLSGCQNDINSYNTYWNQHKQQIRNCILQKEALDLYKQDFIAYKSYLEQIKQDINLCYGDIFLSDEEKQAQVLNILEVNRNFLSMFCSNYESFKIIDSLKNSLFITSWDNHKDFYDCRIDQEFSIILDTIFAENCFEETLQNLDVSLKNKAITLQNLYDQAEIIKQFYYNYKEIFDGINQDFDLYNKSVESQIQLEKSKYATVMLDLVKQIRLKRIQEKQDRIQKEKEKKELEKREEEIKLEIARKEKIKIKEAIAAERNIQKKETNCMALEESFMRKVLKEEAAEKLLELSHQKKENEAMAFAELETKSYYAELLKLKKKTEKKSLRKNKKNKDKNISQNNSENNNNNDLQNKDVDVFCNQLPELLTIQDSQEYQLFLKDYKDYSEKKEKGLIDLDVDDILSSSFSYDHSEVLSVLDQYIRAIGNDNVSVQDVSRLLKLLGKCNQSLIKKNQSITFYLLGDSKILQCLNVAEHRFIEKYKDICGKITLLKKKISEKNETVDLNKQCIASFLKSIEDIKKLNLIMIKKSLHIK